MKAGRLRKILDKFYAEYDSEKRIAHDPIELPHSYKSSADKEAAGLIASSFAYGRVDLFKPVLQKLIAAMGHSPYEFLLEFDVKKHKKKISGIQYRFNRNEDIVCLLHVIHVVLRKYSSIESAFKNYFQKDDINIGRGLAGLMDEFLGTDTSIVYGKNIRPFGFVQFLPSPAKGSACKRANLFLRWMIRDRDIDFGIWKDIPKNRLVVPLDTHIFSISRCLGLTARKSQDWKTAVEITEALKKFDPDDPLKYDFALCHHGISGLCDRKRTKQNCGICVFR